MDAHAMLHAISTAYMPVNEALKMLESQKKVDQKTTLESAVYASFMTIVPSVFVGGKPSGEGASPFSLLKANIKSYAEWKPAASHGDGVSKRIETGVIAIDRRITAMRNEHTSSDVIVLSSTLARDSLLFCTSLCTFIEDQHNEMVESTGYVAADSWEMQLECIGVILEELSAARNPVVDAAFFNPGMYLWGMLQAWKVQTRYMQNNFRDDPALNSVMLRHILYQKPDTQISSKLAKVEELSKTVTEHHRNTQSQIKKLEEKLVKMAPK
jgi:uncharacterized protein YneF (UPF0154 family)